MIPWLSLTIAALWWIFLIITKPKITAETA